MSAVEALRAALAAGIQLELDGENLTLEAAVACCRGCGEGEHAGDLSFRRSPVSSRRWG
jgi:hypothetical protein